jgi:hypothetical protein
VQHGTSRPEINRLDKLFRACKIDIEVRADYVWVDTQNLLNAISSSNPADESDPRKPVYMPFKGLTDIAGNFIRNRVTQATYALDYEWAITWKTTSYTHAHGGKSIVDVVYLYELCRALHTVVNGGRVSAIASLIVFAD